MTLLKSATANALNFSNYATTIYAATDTHESAVQTDTDSGTATSVFMEINRFKNGRVTYDGTGETYAKTWGNEIYGGLSHDGHTTTGNQLTVKALRGAGDPSHVFGGKNEGTTGDVTQNTVDIELAHDDDTIAEVYGGRANNEGGTGKVDSNIANMKKGTVNLLYAGYTFGDGAVTNNTVNFSGGKSTGYIGGGYIDKAASTAEVSYNKVFFTDGTAGQIRGGVTIGSGAAKKNEVEFSAGTAMGIRGAEIEGGTAEENKVAVKGGTLSGDVYGAETSGTGEAKENIVTISGGKVNAEVAGGVGYQATGNIVNISGGTVAGDVYGGKSAGPGSSTSGNIVNLGAEDGTYTANLTNAALHGDNNSGTGATLNVRAKNITAKSADKFENYKFHLNDDIAKNGDSMLTLTENNGLNGGNLFDWTKLDVDTSKLSGSTVIGKATLLTGTTNGLKFSNYAGRNKTTAATNGDYETALRTDTNAATATKVILDYNRFQNNTTTYDGLAAPTTLADGTTTEVYGGISYAGNTTANNHLTVTGVQGNLTSAYGGKTAGAKGDATKNSVTVEATNIGGNAGAISNVIGGYTSSAEASAKAKGNTVTIQDGTVGAVYGGYVTEAASATGNHVFIEGGTVQNAVVGGDGTSAATGNMAGNDITITGGSVTGYVIGGDSRILTSTGASNGNIINLGDDSGTYSADLSGAEIWGTSYAGNVLANDDARIAGNTLNVKAKENGATLKKIRNIEKINFLLRDDTAQNAPLLSLTETGGFGKRSSDNADVAMKWSNVHVDTSKITTAKEAAKLQGKNSYILLHNADNTLKFSDYAARYETFGGVYETGLRTDSGTGTASEVLYDVNRFKDGRVSYTDASTGDALGGYSAFGNTTEGNALTVTGVAASTNVNAYGGKTDGAAGGSTGNVVEITGTGAGTLANVYGGAVTNAANGDAVMGNTVTLTGGTVTGKVYGGYTAGAGKTTGNTVNLGDGTAETLAASTNLENAALYGGSDPSDVRGNTLNVYAKDVTVKSAKNFENYAFHLTDDLAKNGGTMLTFAGTDGFGGAVDWSKITADTSKLSGDTVIGNATLLRSNTANALSFTGYVAQNKTTAATNGDYETALRTDTNAGTATAIILDYNRFQNNTTTYDGSTSPTTLADGTTSEIYGGISYAGNTTANNHLTVENLTGDITSAYGGKTAGRAGDSTGNTVTLTGTGAHVLTNVYGGYVGDAANAGAATGNTVTLTGGKVTGAIYGGYTAGTGATTGNTVNLGNGAGLAAGADLSGASIYGGSKADAAGNVLNIKGRDMTVKTAGNFDAYNFHLHTDVKSGDTLLTFAQAGGFGAAADWTKFRLDGDALHAWGAAQQRTNTVTLLAAQGMQFTGTTAERLLAAHDGMEYGVRTDTGSSSADRILLEANRFKNGSVAFDAATTGEAVGGISRFGNTTESNTLTVKSLAAGAHSAYGGKAMGTVGGSVNNTVKVEGTGVGTLANVYGGAVTNAANAGAVTTNRVNLASGTVENIYGGASAGSGDVTGNTVTLTGGTVTGAVYGGYTAGAGKTTGNTVNLGDGTAATLAADSNLENAALYGGSDAGNLTGNTLNVMVKDAAVKSAQNFENYTFHLTDYIAADKPSSGAIDDSFTASRGTMLTLKGTDGFGGQTVDWNKVTIDTSKLSADKTLGAITLLKSDAAGKLKFSNYAAKGPATGDVSGDYEIVQRTDTNTGEATSVLIDVNRFRNGDVIYDGVNNAKTYSGVSYGGHTAENNKFTLKNIAAGKTIQYLSGGRSEGTAGGAVKNTVTLLGTGEGTLEEVYGGYIGSAANAASATENTVNIAGGTAKNIYAGYTNGTGKTTGNTVNIGYTDAAGVFHDVAAGASVTGVLAGGSDDADATGNTLNVSGRLTAGKIKNFENINFQVKDTMAGGTTLLKLNGTAATEGLDWAKVTLDGAITPAVKSYEAYRLTLMANENGIDFRKGGVDTYAPLGAKGQTAGDYEYVMDTDTQAAQAKAVHADIYRFRGNTAMYSEADGTHAAAWGGRSVLGNDATGNTLSITGGTLTEAYGGWSTGTKADGPQGKTTGNTVNFTGGTVTGTIYGGSNDATGNTLNVTGTQSAGDIKNFEKLHFDTSMAKAGDTILTLNGGKKTTGLDWQKVETTGFDEASLATHTGVAREELFSLMANDKGIDFGTTYDKAKEKTVGDYEYAIAKEADAAKGAAAEKVVVRGFRFQNNADAVYETGDNKAAWGGRSIIGNTVQRNKLTVKGGTLTEAAYGGLSAKGAVTGNTLVLAGGTLKNAYGGFVEGVGDATKNTVEVQKDTQAQIYGGHAAQGEASGNILNLGAVNIGANVYGGSGKKTDGNVINLFGTKIKGTVTGGTTADGKANVLAIRAAGTEIGDFNGVQNLKFYLPEGAKSSMTTMMRLGVKDKDIKGLNVDLDLSGAAKTLKREDVFSLMKVAEGGTLTTDEKIAGEVTGTQGVSLDYKFRVQKKGADELIAAVENVEIKGGTKSLVETRTTATDVLGGGMNLLTDNGIASAVRAADNVNVQVEAAPVAAGAAPDAKVAAAQNVQTGAYTVWAAQGGSSMRVHSGSYVDTHGYTLNVGFARKQEGKDSTLTFGPFVEYGRASYDSYLEDAAGTHGNGKVSYIGAGVLARQDLKSGLYLEGSVRGGQIKSDYAGDVSGKTTSYDISNPYYAIHLGVGKETRLKPGDVLETYIKYFFSHQNGTSGKLSTGEDYDFDAVNSHRLRLGARYTHDVGEEGRFYAGLAWEYEFNGEARATYQGMATPSPSLKGGSGMLELGYRFAPKKSRVSYDINVSGWQGKREGFSGSVGVNWAF